MYLIWVLVHVVNKVTNITIMYCVGQPYTGRMHQIRVHLSWKLMPIVGDLVYRGRPRIPAELSAELRELVQQFPRQALHATKLGLLHPASGEAMQWEVALPEDLQYLLSELAKGVATGDFL